MYLKLGDIQGDCKDKGHEDQIRVSLWSWGMSRPAVFSAQGGTTDGIPNMQDLAISKWFDTSSPRIMEACCKGEHIDKAVLEVWTEPSAKGKKKGARKKEAGRPQGLRITMENVIVTTISTASAEADSVYTETIYLNFARFTYEHLGEGGNGPGSRRSPLRWDIVKNSTF
jgi:type VI secretion system secreted protein Hcp